MDDNWIRGTTDPATHPVPDPAVTPAVQVTVTIPGREPLVLLAPMWCDVMSADGGLRVEVSWP